jgi:hypothetical protein
LGDLYLGENNGAIGAMGIDGTDFIKLDESSGQNAQITSQDNDGFTLTWTKVGSGTGTIYFHILAFR